MVLSGWEQQIEKSRKLVSGNSIYPSKEIHDTNIIFGLMIQYTLANPNRGVAIQKISVLITEFDWISEEA